MCLQLAASLHTHLDRRSDTRFRCHASDDDHPERKNTTISAPSNAIGSMQFSDATNFVLTTPECHNLSFMPSPWNVLARAYCPAIDLSQSSLARHYCWYQVSANASCPRRRTLFATDLTQERDAAKKHFPKMHLAVVLAAFLLLIASSMTSAMELEATTEAYLQGVQNCVNKCDKVFDRTQYAISDQPGLDTFEYRSCIIGCNRCRVQLQRPNVNDDTCFNFCKTYNYRKAGIRKGTIEPDKACTMGCVLNTCQEVCWGGTFDFNVTPRNRHLWWGLGGNGCSIKTKLGYVQNPEYGNPDIGQGASGDLKQCCTNAFNLCFYSGDKEANPDNWANVVLVAQRSCRKYVGSTDIERICAFYNNQQNCGRPGMVPL